MKDIAKLVEKVPSGDVLAFFDHLAKAYQEHQVTKREVARIEAAKEVLLTEIHQKYDFYRECFERLFAERRTVMGKYFEIIDRGLSTGDRDAVLGGLQGLSHLVQTSPFADAANLSKMLENKIAIEI